MYATITYVNVSNKCLPYHKYNLFYIKKYLINELCPSWKITYNNEGIDPYVFVSPKSLYLKPPTQPIFTAYL